MKRMTLKQNQIEANTFEYLVVQVVDATNPKVDERLSERQAARYCSDVNWSVTIK